MKQVGEIVTHVSKELNDQRPNRAFTRWGRGFLLECLNLGLAEIGAYRTEAFCVLTDITLIPGGTQYVNNNITIAAITANSDGTPIRKADNNVDIGYAAYAKNETQCAGGEYKVRTYSVDTKNTHVFYVNPPCPKGATVTVKASLFSGIPTYGPEDWDSELKIEAKYIADLVNYMLARAYGLNSESELSTNNSKAHYSMFYSALGVEYKMDTRRGSGYYSGDVGTGDGQAVNR